MRRAWILASALVLIPLAVMAGGFSQTANITIATDNQYSNSIDTKGQAPFLTLLFKMNNGGTVSLFVSQDNSTFYRWAPATDNNAGFATHVTADNVLTAWRVPGNFAGINYIKVYNSAAQTANVPIIVLGTDDRR